jgi:hypothetical protein
MVPIDFRDHCRQKLRAMTRSGSRAISNRSRFKKRGDEPPFGGYLEICGASVQRYCAWALADSGQVGNGLCLTGRRSGGGGRGRVVSPGGISQTEIERAASLPMMGVPPIQAEQPDRVSSQGGQSALANADKHFSRGRRQSGGPQLR